MRLVTGAAVIVGVLAWPATVPAQVVTVDQQIQLPSAPQFPGGIQIPPRDQSQQRTGTAKIKGRIVNAESGSPLRRAQVRATAGEIQVSRNTTTDAEGRYELSELPAGRYSVNFSKGGYVSLSYGQRRPNEQGKPIELAEGQVIEKVDMSLPRGSAISGRVLDEFGEPVAGVNVTAMRYRFSNGQRRLVPASGSASMTDDLGNYRVYGLAPGEYAVSATLRSGLPMMAGGDSPADRTSFAPTYYPGTQHSAEAQRLTLAVGQDATNISFALIPSRAAKISGMAFDSQGRPLVGQSVSIRQEITTPSPAGAGTAIMMFSTSGSSVRPDGSFTLNNVAPGEYFIEARTRNSDEPESASVPVTVTGEDVSGVSLVTSKGASVRGQIVFDGGIPGTVRPDAVSVGQVSLDPNRSTMMGVPAPRVNDDWTFEMKGVAAGLRTFRAPRAPAGWIVKSVMLNGDDITDKGYDFKGNEEITGLQVVLTNLVSEVVGTVTDPKGNPAREYTIVLFSTERDRWTIPQTRFVKLGRPDQEGKFRVRALPMGEYYAVALDYLEAGEEGDPELLERLKANAQRFSVGDGETKALTVKLSPTS